MKDVVLYQPFHGTMACIQASQAESIRQSLIKRPHVIRKAYEDTLRQVADKLERDSDRMGVKAAYAYGSYVRSESGKYSDLDILIVLEDSFWTAENMARIREYVSDFWDMPVEVDVHACSESQLAGHETVLLESIRKDMSEIWERQKATSI